MRVDLNAFIQHGLIVLIEKCQQALRLNPEQLVHIELEFVILVFLDKDPEFPRECSLLKVLTFSSWRSQ